MDEARFSVWNKIILAGLVVLYLGSLVMLLSPEWTVNPDVNLWQMALNALILTLPLVLFYGSIYLLFRAWLQYRSSGQIHPRLARILHLAPRIAAIVIIFFISLFSLDVFGSGTVLEQIGAFLMHNIPSFVMVALLVVAWKHPVIGFVAFLLAGIFFLRFLLSDMGAGHFMIFSGPLLLIAAMFYVDWRWLNSRAAP